MGRQVDRERLSARAAPDERNLLLGLPDPQRRALEEVLLRQAPETDLNDPHAVATCLSALLRAISPVVSAEVSTLRRTPSFDGFTAAELRVTALVAQGLSNKEVADRLFVSVKAVEAVLTRVYRKQGVCSRAALAVAWCQEQSRHL